MKYILLLFLSLISVNIFANACYLSVGDTLFFEKQTVYTKTFHLLKKEFPELQLEKYPIDGVSTNSCEIILKIIVEGNKPYLLLNSDSKLQGRAAIKWYGEDFFMDALLNIIAPFARGPHQATAFSQKEVNKTYIIKYYHFDTEYGHYGLKFSNFEYTRELVR